MKVIQYNACYMENRSEVPFTWDNKTGLPNQNRVNQYFRMEESFPHGGP